MSVFENVIAHETVKAEIHGDFKITLKDHIKVNMFLSCKFNEQ